jgi:hypothetical protein
MFGLFNRQRSVPSSSPVRTPVTVEGLEGRSMMSVSLNPGSDAALLPAVRNALPAVQHGLLLPAVHPTAGALSTPGTPAPTGFIIAVL